MAEVEETEVAETEVAETEMVETTRTEPFVVDQVNLVRSKECMAVVQFRLHSVEIQRAHIEIRWHGMFPCPDEYEYVYYDDAPVGRFHPARIQSGRCLLEHMQQDMDRLHPDLMETILPLFCAARDSRPQACSSGCTSGCGSDSGSDLREKEILRGFMNQLADHVLQRVGLRTCRHPSFRDGGFVRESILHRLMLAFDRPHSVLLEHAEDDSVRPIDRLYAQSTTSWFRRTVMEPLRISCRYARIPFQASYVEEYLRMAEEAEKQGQDAFLSPETFVCRRASEVYLRQEHARFPPACEVWVRCLNGDMIRLEECIPTNAHVAHALHALHSIDSEKYPVDRLRVQRMPSDAATDEVPIFMALWMTEDAVHAPHAVSLARSYSGMYLSSRHGCALSVTLRLRFSSAMEPVEDAKDDNDNEDIKRETMGLQSYEEQHAELLLRLSYSMVFHTFRILSRTEKMQAQYDSLEVLLNKLRVRLHSGPLVRLTSSAIADIRRVFDDYHREKVNKGRRRG